MGRLRQGRRKRINHGRNEISETATLERVALRRGKNFFDPVREEHEPNIMTDNSNKTSCEVDKSMTKNDNVDNSTNESMNKSSPEGFGSIQSQSKGPVMSQIHFPSLTQETLGRSVANDLFGKIPVNVSVELGRSKVSLKEIYELNEGSIIELERLVGEPLDLVVNGQVVANGEVVAIDNNYGLRLTNIIAKPN